MKRATFTLFAFCTFLIGGCGTASKDKIAGWEQKAARPVTCQAGADCGTKWAKSVTWVRRHARYEIQKISDYSIMTDGPFDSTAAAFSVTRQANPDGTYTINFEAWCGSSFGCKPDVRQLKADFVDFVNGK